MDIYMDAMELCYEIYIYSVSSKATAVIFSLSVIFCSKPTTN